MKPLQLIIITGCLLLAGCQSTTSLPSRLSSGLFGPTKTKHTLSSNSPESPSPSAMQLSSDEFRKGEEALKKGNLKQAKKSFLAVVMQQPDNAAAHHRLGYLADKAGDFTMSRIHYITAMKLEPNNADIVCDLGYSYLLQNRLDESQRYLEKALTINPAHKSSLLNMASLLGKRGDYDGALAIFRQAGSEQEAQENIARLFPEGRPSGKMLASNQQQTNQITQDLQKKMAAFSDARKSAKAQRKQNQKLREIDPREIPTDQINDIFAKIDQDFERKQKAIRSAVPGNRDTIPPQSIQNPHPSADDLIAEYPQQKTENRPPVIPASNRSSSIPGNLPTGNIPGSLEDYAILRPQPETTSGATQAPDSQNNPAEQLTQAPQGGNVPASPAFSSASTSPQQQNAIPQYGLSNQPPAVPAARPSNPEPQTDSANYQQAVALAMQMGMNAGPGQMFPLNSTGSTPASQSYPSGRSYPAGQSASRPQFSTRQPVSQAPITQAKAVPHQSMEGHHGHQPKPKHQHQHPFQHLPIQPPTIQSPQNLQLNAPPVASNEGKNSPAPTEHKPLFSTGGKPSEKVTSYPYSNQPPPREGEIKNWPYAPDSQVQQTSHEHHSHQQTQQIQQAKSETPWLNQTAHQHGSNRQLSPQNSSGNQQQRYDGQRRNQERLPVMQPALRGRHTPAQWPYSPQSGNSQPVLNGPAVHRRAEPPTQRFNSTGRPNSPMPQVVPGER